MGETSEKVGDEHGFSLMELMIVIAIIGILAMIVIPSFISYRQKGSCSAVESDARTVAAHLIDYFAIPGKATFAQPTFTHEIVFTAQNRVVLTGLNQARIEQLPNGTGGSKFTIFVLDGARACPEDYRTANPRWSNGQAWEYTLTI